MLDSLLKSKFYTKCKTNIKVVKTRVEAIKKKKIAVQKFLKNDIADLLRNGLDMNAYGRVEGFMIEQNMTRCYELVENFCVIITSNSHLSLMQKQKECPEECREAVASLMFAAARFADLPELREVRNVFTERYGNSLQAYTNDELMERLSPMEFMKDRKLQVLQDIASEFSVAWDSKNLDQKLFTPPTIQDQTNNTRLNDDDAAGENGTSWPRRNRETSFNQRQNTDRQWNRETSAKQQFAGAKSSSSEDESVTGFSQDDRKTSSSSGGSLSDEDYAADSPGIWRRPPPYLKPKLEKTRLEEDEKSRPVSVRRKNDIDGKKPLPPPPGHEDEAIDGLLMHYSSKKSPYEAGEEAKPRRIRGKRPEPGTAPGRAASLPSETKAAPTETARAPTRAASLQPEGHVYPKLPGDYDELAARIAALRRN